MNPPSTQPQPDPLDTVSLAIMIRAATDAIPHHPDANAEEKAARRHTAFVMISTLRPRDVMEAMLAARITAVQFHIMDDLRCAAQDDLAPGLKLRHRRSAISLTRVQEAAERTLMRLQAFPARQPAVLPASIPAARAQPAPATALSAPARQAAPASRPAVAGQRPAAGPTPRPTTGGFVAPTAAEIEQLVTEVEARLDARAGPLAGDAAGRHPGAATAARPAIGLFAGPNDAEMARLVAEAEAVLTAKAGSAGDLHERLLAEAANRAAASATALAA